ncbi:MAG TPA: hypothetical protein H9870_04055 [Candidatus Corynebacterium avicola]|uniref:Uncharacterized protein n=1 Tax=Candidatus Corynebacterium avicola TaxID=2838527 RepID=A0A9D1UKK5_9CORY|nr:hypothetical protein [Candidatus Corynebacterium avicola]
MPASFPASPVPASAAVWGTVDTDEEISDALLHNVVTSMMSTHGALRAVLGDGEETTVTVPDEPEVAASDIIAEDRTGPGMLAGALSPSTGLVWTLSRLSPTRLLVCVHRGVIDSASWATVIGDIRTVLEGGSLQPAGSWADAAAAASAASAASAAPPVAAPIHGGGPATYKTFDVSDAEALLELLPAQLDTGVEEILAAAVVIARAASGRPIDTVALRSRRPAGETGRAGRAGEDHQRTVGRLDQQYTAAVPHPHAAESDLFSGAPVVRRTVTDTAELLDASVTASDTADPGATVEVSTAKISVTGPVRPVDGVAHVILGTQALARISVVDERGGADGVLLWRWLEQALISLSALARLIDAGSDAVPHEPVPARSGNLFGADPAADLDRAGKRPDRTVDLRHLPEVNGFEVARHLADNHPGGTTLVLMPGVTDPKATGGRSGRVGRGVTARLITER